MLLRRAVAPILACALAAGCALGGTDGAPADPARAAEPTDPGGDPGGGPSGGGSGAPRPDAGAKTDAARDATPREASSGVDAHPDSPGPGACGVCDRTWVCNGFAQYWASEADGRCVNQSNRTGLRCNGVLDGSTANNVGTWTGSTQGLTLNFQTLGGGTHVITCTP